MLNVQTLGILLRALRDGNARPDAPRAPAAIGSVARVARVAADANESSRGDAAVRTLPGLLGLVPALITDDRETLSSGPAQASAHPAADPRIAARGARAPDGSAAAHPAARGVVEGANASAAIDLSATGRWLTGMHNRVPETATAATRAMMPPLVAEHAVQAPALAAALENAIATSGVFYEAHLARWLADDLPLSALAHEPQAAWTTPPHADFASAASLPQDADKIATVARQLEALDTRTVLWSGAPWPDQQASIEIREDESGAHRESSSDANAPPAWQTRITMTLPSLGRVEATLALRGDAIEVRLVAPETTQPRLAGARDELRAALAARALELTAFSIGTADGR